MHFIKKLASPIGISILVTVLVSSSVAVGAFLMTREIPSQVKVLGSEAEVYADFACTELLTALDYGEMRELEDSDLISFFVRNEGDDPIYLAMSQTDLPNLLSLFANDSLVPQDPELLKLNYVEGTDVTTALLVGIDDVETTVEVDDIASFDETGTLWCEDEAMDYTGTRAYVAEIAQSVDLTGASVTSNAVMSASTTTFAPSSDLGAFTESGVVKVNDELFSYTGKSAIMFQGITRGEFGTTAVEHASGSVFEQAVVTPYVAEVTAAFTGVTRGTEGTVAASHAIDTAIEARMDVYTAVAPNEVFEAVTFVRAEEDVERTMKEFAITILAAATKF